MSGIFSEKSGISENFAAEKELSDLLKCEKVDNEQALKLREAAMVFLKTCITKLSERNQLMSSIVRNSKTISPNMIATKNHKIWKTNVKNLIRKVVNLKIFEFKVGDGALTEFTKFLSNEYVIDKQKFLNFEKADQRLDKFYFKELKVQKYPSFATLLKVMITISHGQCGTGL